VAAAAQIRLHDLIGVVFLAHSAELPTSTNGLGKVMTINQGGHTNVTIDICGNVGKVHFNSPNCDKNTVFITITAVTRCHNGSRKIGIA
jgi:hypothetical protein